ncbi:hypothetical protein [Bosea sp. R86505]|uniref:hypothetical protein n=1 Tax=Bosea sp. R86505 TaxID=3101710 RepID=UPI00366A8E41
MTDPVTASPLRQRMIEDMTIRRFGEHTQRDYVRQVREFTAFLDLSPDRAKGRCRPASARRRPTRSWPTGCEVLVVRDPFHARSVLIEILGLGRFRIVTRGGVIG